MICRKRPAIVRAVPSARLRPAPNCDAVFSERLSTLDLIAPRLGDRCGRVGRLRGGSGPRRRVSARTCRAPNHDPRRSVRQSAGEFGYRQVSAGPGLLGHCSGQAEAWSRSTTIRGRPRGRITASAILRSERNGRAVPVDVPTLAHRRTAGRIIVRVREHAFPLDARAGFVTRPAPDRVRETPHRRSVPSLGRRRLVGGDGLPELRAARAALVPVLRAS